MFSTKPPNVNIADTEIMACFRLSFVGVVTGLQSFILYRCNMASMCSFWGYLQCLRYSVVFDLCA